MQNEDDEVASEVRITGTTSEHSGWVSWRVTYMSTQRSHCQEEPAQGSVHYALSQRGPRVCHVRDPCLQNDEAGRTYHRKDGNAGVEVENEDGDGDKQPKRRKRGNRSVLRLRVKTTSSAKLCGLQVWGAALLLSDWILHNRALLEGAVVVELGAGPGLPGLIAAGMCSKVFVTDFDEEILLNCVHNIEANGLSDSCVARKLDWADPDPFRTKDARANAAQANDVPNNPKPTSTCTPHLPPASAASAESDRDPNAFAWGADDIAQLPAATILLAADVIYSNDLTDLLVGQLRSLLAPRSRKLILALEKRTNFTLPEMASTSREYDYFFSKLREEIEGVRFGFEHLPTNFPQLLPYTRTQALELWQIERLQRLKPPNCPKGSGS